MAERALNIAAWERWTSLVTGLALAALGVLLLERGVTGSCRLYRRIGRSTAPRQDDWIDEASDDSFPASDPPSWTSTSSVGSPRSSVH